MNLGRRREIYMSLATLFANSFNKWGCDIDQILLHGDNFSSEKKKKPDRRLSVERKEKLGAIKV